MFTTVRSIDRRVMYDRAAVFWQTIIMVITHLQDMGVYEGQKVGMLNAQLWGAHMRFFRQMLMASKARNKCIPGPTLIYLGMLY